MDELNVIRNETPIFFLHIHKTAGTSFISLLDQQYTTADVCPSDWPYRQKIYEVSKDELASAKFIRGHFSYDELRNEMPEMPRIITFLRDPVARFISHFEHLHRAPGDPEGVHEQIAGLSLTEFVLRPELASTIENMGVRLIGGWVGTEGKRIPNLALAKERLAAFEFIGIQDKFVGSMELFSYLYCLPPTKYLREDNVAPFTTVRSDLSEHTLSIIAEINRDDIELYDFGRNLFEKRYTAMMVQNGDNFAWGQDFSKKHSYSSNLERVYPGQGWYIGEKHPKYGNVRWSGPETASYLYLALADDRDMIIRFRVVQAISPEVLESLTLEINGRFIELTRIHEKGEISAIFEGQIPASALRRVSGVSVLTFRVARTYCPGEFDPQNLDTRRLGLCYNWLHIYPA